MSAIEQSATHPIVLPAERSALFEQMVEAPAPRRTPLVLGCIMAFAALIRILCVVRFPWEQDELYTLDEGLNLLHTHILPGIQARPLFFLIEHPLLEYLPHDPVTVRMLPLLFGIAGVWATWRLGREYLGKTTGLIAATLIAVMPWHLYASGFARYYSLLYLLAAALYVDLPRALDSDRPRDHCRAFLLLAAGTLSHPTFVFPAAGASAALVFMQRERRSRRRYLAISQNSLRWLWGPYAALLIIRAAVLKLMGTPSGFQNGYGRGLPAALRLIPAMVDWMTVTVFVAAIAGSWLLLRSRIPRERRLGTMAAVAITTTCVGLWDPLESTCRHASLSIL